MAGAETALIQLAVLFAGAQAASYAASVVRVPRIVGMIVFGIVAANTRLSGWIALGDGAEFLGIIAELGVVFLIFTVGLETDLKAMLQVGGTAATTAVLGVVAPFAAGAGMFLLLEYPLTEALFVGTALVATSVGITARVLSETGTLQTAAARIILGAAVIDDVLGLMLLTIISGVAATGAVSATEVLVIVGSAAVFFVLAWGIGHGVIRTTLGRPPPSGRPSRWNAFLHDHEFPVLVAIALCLGFSALATQFRLAPIVGAFLAGLLFDPTRGQQELTKRFETITVLLAPFFFVYIGLAVDLAELRTSLGLVAVVTILAVATKIVGCGLGALREGRATALAVGIGMAPRGEVGIIVALLGLSLGIVEARVYGVVVAMSVLTTIIAPLLLPWAMRRVGESGRDGAGAR